MSIIFILTGCTVFEALADAVNALYTKHYKRTHNKRKVEWNNI